jgi:hypothetical protein
MPAVLSPTTTVVAGFRITPAERDRLKQVAVSAGLTWSELVRAGLARVESDLSANPTA